VKTHVCTVRLWFLRRQKALSRIDSSSVVADKDIARQGGPTKRKFSTFVGDGHSRLPLAHWHTLA
jgi:hypothetical protein